MSVWTQVRLGDHLSRRSADVVVDAADRYRTTGVLSHGRGLFWRPEIGGVETSYRTFTRLRKNDFVFSKLFGWEGALDVVSDDFGGGLVSSEFPVFEVAADTLDPTFLRYVVRRPDFYEALAVSGMGNRRQRVNPDTMLDSSIPLPTLDEQRRIASWLAEVENLSSEISVRRRTSSRLAGGLIDSLANELSERFGTAPMSMLMSQRRPEVAVLPSSKLTLAGIYSHGGGLFSRGDIAGTDTQYPIMSQLTTGQFVYSKLKAWEGALAVVTAEHDGHVLSPEFPVFDLDQDRICPEFLQLVLKSEAFLDGVRGAASGIGARRDRVHPSSVLALQIPAPPLGIQRRVVGSLAGTGIVAGRSERAHAIDSLLNAGLNQVFGS